MEKSISKQELKTAAFTIEVIADKNEPTRFIIRSMNGQPIRICNDVNDVAEFLNDVERQIKDSYEREDQ